MCAGFLLALVPLAGAQTIATTVVAGDNHTCAINETGGVQCWGFGTSGQLGDGNTISHDSPVVAAALSNIVGLAAGSNHTCALGFDGIVKCWGANALGQLGLGGTGFTYVATAIPGLTGVAAIAAGGDHTCAIIAAAGTVKCWGSNFQGEIGDNTQQGRLVPTTVQGLSGVVALALGWRHSCALTSTSAMKCWGANSYGAIGDNTFIDRYVPTDVPGLGTGAIAIAAGRVHTCALPNAGGLKCWGNNQSGQLGDGTNFERGTPTDVQGLASGVMNVVAGMGHTCAMTAAGVPRCWGRNVERQLADGTTTDRNAPVTATGFGAGVAKLFAGGFHTCSSTLSGSLKCAGENSTGQLGNNNMLVTTTATAVSYYNPALLSLAAGDTHTCALLYSGGVKCWGLNTHGELGDGTFDNRTMPALVPDLLAQSITATQFRTCAVSFAGGAKCWGSNFNGALGDGSQLNRAEPRDVVGLTSSVRKVAPGHNHTCAIKYDDTVMCWGGGNSGQLGTGNNNQALTPVAVLSVTNAASVSAGNTHTCIRKNDGDTRCWGGNLLGQLGDNTFVNRNTQGIIFGFPMGVSSLQVGADHGCALNPFGGAECWGRGTDAQLGNNTLTNTPYPVPVSGLGNGTVTSVITGGYHSCAITTGGGAKCWGYNNFGSLGDGTNTDRTTPVDVAGLSSGVLALEGGDFHTCAILANGAAKCWGANSQGQVGTGSTSLPVTTPAHTLVGGQWIDFLPFTNLDIGISYPFPVSATNGGAVELETWTPAICTVFSNYVTGLANGICGLRAKQSSAVTLPPAQLRLIRIGSTPPAVRAHRYFDATGGGTTDITWRDANDQAALWLMNGTAITGSGLLLGPSTGWTVTLNTGDFNGDARSDLVWTHTDGRVAMWMLDGLNVVGSGLLLGPGTGWSATHVGDFNGDGRSDILWKNTDGSVAMWLLDGMTVLGSAIVFGPNAAWTVSHVADLDGNGASDLVWRNTDGSVTGWLMNGIAVAASGYIFGPGTTWQVIRTGDFNGNGAHDLLFRDAAGQLSIFLMNGLGVASSGLVYSGGAFDITHVADFNNDGRSDLLFKDAGGQVAIWLLDGTSVTGSAIVFGGGGGWQVTHVGDFNADGSADLLWKDGTGQVAVWMMNGVTPGATALIFGGGGGWVASP